MGSIRENETTKENSMKITKIGNKSQAKLELFKIDRRIEKKIEQHVNELGKHNTDIVERELEQLWAKKSLLVNFINS
tara:strand:+ start:360 stop:590 length:231 start_codon:yes stop_codon:yes gene_type:complete